jgi:hypothetical protein
MINAPNRPICSVRSAPNVELALPSFSLSATPKPCSFISTRSLQEYPIHRRKVQRKLAGLTEADHKQRALGAGAPAAFVPGAVNQWFETNTPAHEQRTDSLGRIDLDLTHILFQCRQEGANALCIDAPINTPDARTGAHIDARAAIRWRM